MEWAALLEPPALVSGLLVAAPAIASAGAPLLQNCEGRREWSEGPRRLNLKQRAFGSTEHAAGHTQAPEAPIAQMVEHFTSNEEVLSSILNGGIFFFWRAKQIVSQLESVTPFPKTS